MRAKFTAVVLAAFASVLVNTPAASAAVVTFESLNNGNAILSGATVIEGLTFTSDHYHVTDTPGLCNFGGCVEPANYLAADAPTLAEPVVVTWAGGSFSVTSLDSAQLWLDDAAAAAGGFANGDFLHLVGNLTGGGTVTQDIALGNAFAGAALIGFTGLDSLVISAFIVGGTDNASWAVDNIAWVPEPSLLLMAGAGMAAYLRRRQKARAARP